MAFPWYRIHEIPVQRFGNNLSGIFSVLEGQNKSKTSEDPLLRAILRTRLNWDEAEKVRLAQKALEGKTGDFHEIMHGEFDGLETLPNGHITECDVMSKGDHRDSTGRPLIMEIKNRHNTIKGKDGKHTIDILKNHANNGFHAVLVQVNCPKNKNNPKGKVNRFGADSSVDVWNGYQSYAFLSGREDFYDDLIKTMDYVFANFKTYDQLKAALGTP